MIDIAHEQLLSMLEAAKRVPGRVHVSTVWRWSLRGVRGRVLETVIIGGRRYTSAEALERFAQQKGTPSIEPQLSTRRLKQIEAAEKRLSELGV